MKVTIITVVYNAENTLQNTIDSVRSQNYNDIEYIVVDGGSTDKTSVVLNKNKHKIDKLISERDDGIYDAMNKGIRIAIGHIIGILNADDFYANDSIITDIVNKFQETNSDGIYGDLVYVDKDDPQKIIRYWKAGKYVKNNFLWGWMPPHPTVFLKKSIYERFGLFNTQFKSAADYEFLLRIIYKHNIKLDYIEKIITKMRVGGKSNVSLSNRIKANKEDLIAWKINGLKPYFFTTLLKPIIKIKQYWERPINC